MPDTNWPPGLGVMLLADDSPGATVHPQWDTGEPSARGYGGAQFIDRVTHEAVEAPPAFVVPHDYIDRYPYFEVVGQTAVVRPAGPADKPYAKTHTFPHAEAFILHMIDGDYRYRVTHQPDKYDDETGEVAERAGDPTTHVDWFFVAELEGKVS